MGNQPHKGRPRRRRGGSRGSNRGQSRRRQRTPRVNWRDILDDSIWDLRGRLVEIRRDFHRYPELAFEEKRTAGVIAETQNDLGLEVQEGIAGTGVVGSPVLQYIDGKQEVVWPADIATAEFVFPAPPFDER